MASKLSRMAQLGALTTRVSSSYLGNKVAGIFQGEETRKASLDRTHQQNAERIVANLGSLKGAAMKVGQAIAQMADGYGLPAEAMAALGKLHDKAEPVPFEVVKRRIESELAGGLDTLFASFDPEPLGTASLGQAHGARLPDGTDVVVKVLHEGIDGSVHADLGALRAMLTAGRVLRRPKEEVDAIFQEIEQRLAEELDYRLEAANLKEFRAFFHNDPNVTIPMVHDGWSTGRVLTMERLVGRPLPVFVATGTPAAKQHAGATLGRASMRMQYELRAIHADPHPGNYLFTPDGRVGILDFGCVRRLDLDWIASYGECGLAVRNGDREALMEASVRIRALTHRGDKDAEDVLWELCRAIGKPFAKGAPYTMGGEQDDIQDIITGLVPRLLASSSLRSPHELVFLHRALGGVYQILKQLKATADWGGIFEDVALRCVADRDRASRVSVAGTAR
ncbi:MAG: AarF/ABC1/UbiB kinase family protein [Pseudomonadota bacterium]|nr:AarF/ABC1/UbiB kinase family protein [Pseudomonadota bacterium]